MIIYLYLDTKILKFRLPNQVIGSYTFDEFEYEEDKLINVDAKGNDWVLYSTKNSKIISGISAVESVVLRDDSFYVVQRNDRKYLLYVTNGFNNNYKVFKYKNDLNIIIGNAKGCNISYPTNFLNDNRIGIHYVNNVLTLEKTDNKVIFVNNKVVTQSKFTLKSGDEIDVYGLKLHILNNTILINNPGGKVIMNLQEAKLEQVPVPELEKPQNVEIKDIDLYGKNDYYLKSPRIRRTIESKEIKLTAPPKTEAEKELPLILTIGPMFTMGLVSLITLLSTIGKISAGETTWAQSITQLVTTGAMLVSMVVWPLLTRFYGDMSKKRSLRRASRKYKEYLEDKRIVLSNEEKLQREILNENLISVEECVNIIQNKSINFWDKRIDQSDFLTFRIGKGDQPLDINLQYQEDDFTLEHNKLKEKVDALLYEYKYIKNVPIGYSFSENAVTAVLGNHDKCLEFMDNILLQLLTFYTYEDVKIVLFTDSFGSEKWEYIKYLNHNFNNEKNFRFFSSDYESAKNIMDYLSFELNNRLATEGKIKNHKPHYFIIVDGYDQVKRFNFIRELAELEDNLGFSLVILEERMGNLPSKCNNFISIGQKNSGVLKNSYENQEKILFNDEINNTIDMMMVSKQLSNVPIEFEEGIKELPESIAFLEMERVGKVEQLNILNRWNKNDSTQSLKAEVGVDENNELIYLDLHEKFHGPHGLIAGMTGSGKSEFIITYILSLAMNYSPDDVEFILIDYKGGGLAFAFENKTTGVSLPHLAGTITNLDKAEMDRTLVSIDSEIKRRQDIFNKARDLLGESTIDIYKYQRFYKEGKLSEPVPHLFIICDEFAELKDQQPDFMDNLISVARIGRSLGVHLILATQKPSGVVNDQIWSNTKFRVCLKVQDESDSKEMLKRPEAASLRQTGRFYLQVGFDELFLLGQSGWCGAKYYPSDKIVKQIDRSINFVNDNGLIIKSAEAGVSNATQAQGEQLSAIMNNIIQISNLTNKKARRLWLDNIPEVILSDALVNKYNVEFKEYNPIAIIGEYDAPEKQVQGIVKYDFLNQGNTIVYGLDGSERELLLDTMIYSSTKNHSSNEINYYIIDYGSESLRKYSKLPHLGGIVFSGEDEKYHNLFKMIKEELQKRKKLFADFGGEYKNYIQNSNEKLPVYVVILNNYDSIYDSNQDLYDELPDLIRDSERYGVVFILTASAINSIASKITQNCSNTYALKLKDSSDYSGVFGKTTKITPREMNGRGLVEIDGVHEFQTAHIVDENTDLNKFISEFVKEQKTKNLSQIKKIPTLPDIVRYEDISDYVIGLNNVPIGIEKGELNVSVVDYLANTGNIISSNKLASTEKFVKSLITVLANINNLNVIVFDVNESLKLDKQKIPNYFTKDVDKMLGAINDFIQKLIDAKDTKECAVIIYGLDKFISKIDDISSFETLFKNIKTYEHATIIVVDDANKIKKYNYETWYSSNFNNSEGIWIGRGVSDQGIIHLSNITKEMTKEIKTDMGYYVNEGVGTLCRLIDFITEDNDEE